jgi:tyrosinase
MPRNPTRRSFIRRTASWAALAGLGPFLGSCEGCLERIRNRPIRRSLATLPDNDPIIETYREAVAAMKALPGTDNRSWTRQAQIHFDHCPHGNWWFLPWHRAYLHYFEEICRDLTGNDDFALPYWDWTANPSVPAPFWGDASNALFQSGRSATPASVANASMVGRPEIDSILNETDFFLFASGAASGQRDPSTYGRLEGTPHNYVHGFVGGIMGSYQSPQDPIFWMHHNMIECLWVEWNIVRKNHNTNDPAWSGFTFSQNFFDTAGTPVDISVGVTLLMPVFTYQFDGACGGMGGDERMRQALADTAALRTFLNSGGPPRVETGRRFPVQQALQLTTRAPVSSSIPIDAEAVAAVTRAGTPERLLLRVENVVPPRTESFFVRVFLNLPNAGPETPTEDPHYAGSFAFFTDSAHAEAGTGAYIVDMSEALRRLAPSQQAQAVEVRMVAVPFRPAPAVTDSLTIRGLGLELARVREGQR